VVMPGDQRADIRNTINHFLTSHHSSAPPFIVNKLSKVVVDVAKTDWPHFYPDFFTRILQLASTPTTMRLGLGMLLIASEELAAPREDLPYGRKDELKKLLNVQVPQVLHLLAGILESVLDRRMKEAKSFNAPPSSPQQAVVGQRSDGTISAQDSYFTSSPVQQGSLLHAASMKLLHSSGQDNERRHQHPSSPALAPNDRGQEDEVASLALRCVAQIFSWVPFTATAIDQGLIDVLFRYAAMAADPVSSIN